MTEPRVPSNGTCTDKINFVIRHCVHRSDLITLGGSLFFPGTYGLCNAGSKQASNQSLKNNPQEHETFSDLDQRNVVKPPINALPRSVHNTTNVRRLLRSARIRGKSVVVPIPLILHLLPLAQPGTKRVPVGVEDSHLHRVKVGPQTGSDLSVDDEAAAHGEGDLVGGALLEVEGGDVLEEGLGFGRRGDFADAEGPGELVVGEEVLLNVHEEVHLV